MAEMAVSVFAGVIASALNKLHSLQVIKLQDEISSLQGELALMSACMHDFEMMEARNMQVHQEWSRQVREIAYDIEDFIDLYQHHLRRSKSIRSIFSSNHGLGGGFDFDAQIKRLKARVVEASERLRRFDLQAAVNNQVRSSSDATIAGTAAAHARSSSTTIDPRLSISLAEDPIAMEGPKEELLQFLNGDQTHVKVASIVGMAGIGKTTLAAQVYSYRTLSDRFHTRAFICVGPRPSVTTVLLNIISQITAKLHKHHKDIADEHDGINTLRDLLRDKRAEEADGSSGSGQPADGNGGEKAAWLPGVSAHPLLALARREAERGTLATHTGESAWSRLGAAALRRRRKEEEQRGDCSHGAWPVRQWRSRPHPRPFSRTEGD